MEKVALYYCKRGEKYIVVGFEGHAESVAQKLVRIGLRVGEEITVTNFNFGKNAMLIKIKGISFALDAKICKGVMVESA